MFTLILGLNFYLLTVKATTPSDPPVSAPMDGVLLFANANQELSFRRRELMRPQLNTNYRHLCGLSNPITAELSGDDLPKAV